MTKPQDRKNDHIELAFESQTEAISRDRRFYFEPALAGHPKEEDYYEEFSFVGKTFRFPLWVSSMTGGTELAKEINTNLAKLCGKHGLGMGLGSCRKLISHPNFVKDFQLRKYIGDEHALFANLGIAQIEEWLPDKFHLITEILKKTEADGLIVHLNPLQEWLQPEGDRYHTSPLLTLTRLMEKCEYPVIVKEVGQGMGPESLFALMRLPLAAIEISAFGGTNFSLLENLRQTEDGLVDHSLDLIGHDATEMVDFINEILNKELNLPVDQFILSGGVKNYLDGYYLNQRCHAKSIYGQASALLKYASVSYELLERYLENQIRSYAMARNLLKIK